MGAKMTIFHDFLQFRDLKCPQNRFGTLLMAHNIALESWDIVLYSEYVLQAKVDGWTLSGYQNGSQRYILPENLLISAHYHSVDLNGYTPSTFACKIIL